MTATVFPENMILNAKIGDNVIYLRCTIIIV